MNLCQYPIIFHLQVRESLGLVDRLLEMSEKEERDEPDVVSRKIRKQHKANMEAMKYWVIGEHVYLDESDESDDDVMF